MKVKELSVFFPAYNEEANIENTVNKAAKILPKAAQKWEILIVNDGSKDKTGEIAHRLAKGNKNIRVIHHPKNRGYGGVFKTGLYNCRYQLIAFTDADGQFDFSEIGKFLEKIKKADLVAGYRLERRDPFIRLVNARLWEILMLVLFGLNIKDPDCGFKLTRKEVVDKVGRLKTESAVTEPEFLIRAKRAGFKIAQVAVHHYPRKAGKQTGANLKVITKALKESMELWLALRKN
jgi:glycosyltransferase involved in cell wall biosynthesis